MAAKETEAQKFNRLCKARLDLIDNEIRKFTNLSNPYIYEYDEQTVKDAFDHIEDHLNEALRKFEDGLRKLAQLRERRAGQQPAPQSIRERITARRTSRS